MRNDNDKPWLLNERQRSVVATALTVFSTAVLLAAIYYGVVLLRVFVGTFSHVLLPLAIAAILATLLQPVVSFFDRKLHLGRVGSIALLALLVLGVLAGLAVYLVPMLVTQIKQFIDVAPKLQDRMFAFLEDDTPGLWMWLKQHIDFTEVSNFFKNDADAEKVSGAAVQDGAKQALDALRAVGSYLTSLFSIAAAYAVVPVYLCFMLYKDSNRWPALSRELSFLSDQRRDDLIFLIRQFTEIIISFFRGQLIVGLIFGAFLAVGFQIAGLQLGLIIGMIAGLLNVIPYLGTILGLGTALPLAYFQEGGGWTLSAVVLGIFIVGQLLVDYLVLPKVMGKRTGMSQMLIIFSIFFWGTALNGILGMVLAIPLTAFFLVFWRLLRDKYIPMMKLKAEDEEAMQSALAGMERKNSGAAGGDAAGGTGGTTATANGSGMQSDSAQKPE